MACISAIRSTPAFGAGRGGGRGGEVSEAEDADAFRVVISPDVLRPIPKLASVLKGEVEVGGLASVEGVW